MGPSDFGWCGHLAIKRVCKIRHSLIKWQWHPRRIDYRPFIAFALYGKPRDFPSNPTTKKTTMGTGYDSLCKAIWSRDFDRWYGTNRPKISQSINLLVYIRLALIQAAMRWRVLKTFALSDLHDCAKTADCIINILPLTEETTHLYEEAFAQMKFLLHFIMSVAVLAWILPH